MSHLRIFKNRDVDSIADAMIRAICGAEAEEMIRHKLTLAVSPDGETRFNRISHAVYFDVLFKRLAPYERRWKSMLRSLWADERAIILANLKKLKGGNQAGRHKGASDNIMYPASQFKNRLSKETKKLLTVMLADLGKDKLDELDLGTAFDISNPRIKQWLENYSFKFSENLEAVNDEKLRRILEEGFETGKSIPELMREVKECFDSWDVYRAEVISRTETSRAANEAAVEAYRQSGVVEKKEWLVAPGCCDACEEVGKGDPIPLEDTFKSEDFDDVDAPPLHPNCRCACLAYLE